ncbi:MAG: hypothetical protein V3T08_08085 [Gemmatimonadota bacterium]
MGKCGFEDVEVLSQQGMGQDWLRLYPIFSGEFLDLMFRMLPKERHNDTILAAFMRGYKPA